jgi:hypothetical protein
MQVHAGLRVLASIASAVVCAALPAAGDVTLEPVPASTRFPGAVEPEALRLACSADEREVAARLGREGLPFRADLLRREDGRACHLFYRPTVPGFRAAPDDDAVTRVLFDTDPVLYLVAGGRNRGEPVGAMRDMLRSVPRPLDVSVLLHRAHEARAYEDATRAAFRGTPHRVSLLDRGVDRTFWWVQDWVKSGATSAGKALLVPRRIFEGRADTADAFDPLLDRLAREEGVVRSRLSWEGGDLQFTRDPGDPSRVVLYYGASARPYWAETLTPREYEYVLALEFGADRAVDLAGLAPHVDYFVSFLPGARVALVGVPVSGERAAARGAVEALLARFDGGGPRVLAELRDELASPSAGLDAARKTLERARGEQAGWQLAADPTLPERMRALSSRACPAGGDCLSPDAHLRLLEEDPATFADWVHATRAARDEPAVIAAHLDLVESQLDPVPEAVARRAREAIGALEAIGFRVVQVPAFRVDLRGARAWPGISYVNALVVDRLVFVPRFGLGAVEDRLFRDLGSRLPEGYSVVPVDAQQILVRGGGLHCLAGLVR